MTKLLSDRVKKIPATQVSAERYSFLKLSEAEPDLGVPAANGYVLASQTDGTRSWVTALSAVSAPGSDGQLVYNNGGSLGGSSLLYYDDVNQRLGIGTTSPSAKLDIAGDIEVNSLYNLNGETATLATVTQTQIASFAVATYASGKFVVQAKDSVSGEVHVTELLVVHNGTTASATEYGTIHTGTNPLATYEVDINSGNVRILATAASANSTTYKVSETLITA